MNNQRDTFLELRGKFDGQDPFMTGGHQIIKLRTGDRVIPEWTKSDKKIQAILLRSFPKLRTDPKQRVSAARWATIIQLYYRMQMTQGQVAAQMKLRPKVVGRLIENITFTVKHGSRSRGRPKKIVGVPKPPVDGSLNRPKG